MEHRPSRHLQTVAVAAAVLIAGVAAFQFALVLGAPVGEAVFAGSAPTDGGTLTIPFRALAAPHPVERWVMGSITLILTGLGLFIALRAPDIA